ncbi:MAG: EutN/CcmL family microcompartment protein [Candidatus Eremiobacteraeota bacterium]|nr:EutN/CcmL family microcompartment protein [Candidatus Eremiobacteraeota bacterium]
MFLGRVCGTVVATHRVDNLEGATFRVVVPVNHDGSTYGKPFVAVDNVSATTGDLVYLVKGKEAIIPWKRSDVAPIDAAIVGLVDGMDV